MNTIIAVMILLAYTLVMIGKIGTVPNSLSESVFCLKYNFRWIWTVVIFLVCYLCVPTYIEKTSENSQFLAFMAIAGLAFVGAAPLVKYKEDHLQFEVHQWGAIVCAFCSQVLLCVNCPLLLLCWVPWIIAFVWITRGGKWRTLVFWGEMVCFSSTFAYCLI